MYSYLQVVRRKTTYSCTCFVCSSCVCCTSYNIGCVCGASGRSSVCYPLPLWVGVAFLPSLPLWVGSLGGGRLDVLSEHTTGNLRYISAFRRLSGSRVVSSTACAL